MKKIALIMAGGSGERFWPLSRKEFPKQLLRLFSGHSMLEEAIARIAHTIPMQDIYIITSQLLQKPIQQALPDFPADNIIAEPSKRNTAPCLALGAALISARTKLSADQITVGVFTADHFIRPAAAFAESVTKAMDFAAQNPNIVTIGIQPTRPETGYGYIEVLSQEFDGSGIQPVHRFREKPNLETALDFLESGHYLWNSGMFFYRLDTFHKALEQAMPETSQAMVQMQDYLHKHSYAATDQQIISLFNMMDEISVDYGIMEKAKNVSVLPAAFQWDDVGSWDALARLRTPDNHGNISNGNVVNIECTESILWNENPGSVLAAIAIHNLTVISTPDAVMICPTDKAQQVRSIVHQIRQHGDEHLL
jgi:mannose-1-phosphate guanylyltransferase